MTRILQYMLLAACVAWLGCSGATENNMPATEDRISPAENHMTEAAVDKLLATTDDFQLCDGVFCAITDVTENELSAATEPEPCRTVTLIWHSGGIIGNGGFQYLFGGNFNGDPGYRITADAYRKVGAEKCYSAFQDALALFPRNTLPDDIERRLEIYQSHPKETRDAINDRFWVGADEMKPLLARFIRSHRSEIREFLTNHP